MSDDQDLDYLDSTCPNCDAPGVSKRCRACGWVATEGQPFTFKPTAMRISSAESNLSNTPSVTQMQASLNEDQSLILERVEVKPEEAPPQDPIPLTLSEKLCFLTGQAGTGKTWLAKRIIEEWGDTILAATTGIAAVNLGEGTTINALLSYFDTADLRDKYQSGRLSRTLANLAISGIKRIVVDEISMMDGEQLTVLTRAAEEVSGDGYIVDDDLAEKLQGKNVEPISIILTGDFCQLPPVKAAWAFESPEWPKFAKATHKLTTIRRQSDLGFIQALNAARSGYATPVCDFFGGKMSNTLDTNFDGSTIFAKNDEVARFNALKLDRLKEDAVGFTSERWGLERGDWKQIPQLMDLKKGALVMILANQRYMSDAGVPGPLKYANGDLGHVAQIDVDRAEVWVTLHRNGKTVPIEWLTRQNLIPLEVGRKKQLEQEGHPERVVDKFEVIGEVRYLPMRVAYATTVHKSQGLSLDRVQIDIRGGFFRAPAMLYVALSRARTSEGLRLVGNVDILRKRCVIDERVKPWL